MSTGMLVHVNVHTYIDLNVNAYNDENACVNVKTESVLLTNACVNFMVESVFE